VSLQTVHFSIYRGILIQALAVLTPTWSFILSPCLLPGATPEARPDVGQQMQCSLNSSAMTIMPEDEKCLYDAKKVRGRILIMGSEANSDLQRDGILRSSLKIRLGKSRPILVRRMRCILRHNPSPVVVPFPQRLVVHLIYVGRKAMQ